MPVDLICEYLETAHAKANTAIVMIDNGVGLATINTHLDQIADNIEQAMTVLEGSNLVVASRIDVNLGRAANHLEYVRRYLDQGMWSQASESVDQVEQYIGRARKRLPDC